MLLVAQLPNFNIVQNPDNSITVFRRHTDKFGHSYFTESATYATYTDIFQLLEELYHAQLNLVPVKTP